MTSPAPLRRVPGFAAAGALLGAGLLALFVAAGPGIRIPFDVDPPRLVGGLYPAERDAASGLTFAWTGPDMSIRLPGLDRRRAWVLALRVRSGRADAAAHPTLSFSADGLLLGSEPSSAAFRTIRVTLPARPQRPRGAAIRMQVSETMVPGGGDPRSLGVMLDEVGIAPEGPATPPADAVLAAAAGGAALGGAAALFAGGPAGAAAVLVLAAGQGAMVARGFGPYTGYPGTAAALALWIAAAMAIAAFWMHRRSPAPLAAARAAILVSAGGLFLKLLVLLHPEMPIGDAMFHAHRFQGVLAGNLYFTSIAPGNYTFPYPPGFYVFASAFAGLVRRGAADMALLRIAGLAVDAAAGASLYLAVRRGWPGPWGAAAAVALYQLIPLEFRIFTVGNLTNAFAQSLAVLALALICSARFDRLAGRETTLLAALLTAAFLSHTSTFPILFAACTAIALLLWWRRTDADSAPGAVLLATGCALALAIGLYYAHFGETYRAELARIGTETAAASPDAGGRTIGARAAIVPMYLRLYLGPAALLLAAAGAWALGRRAPRERLTLAAAGWTLACLAFLALGVLTPVDMRYYLASIPAIAIAGAAGLRFLWERGTGGRVAAVALAALALADGALTWWQTF